MSLPKWGIGLNSGKYRFFGPAHRQTPRSGLVVLRGHRPSDVWQNLQGVLNERTGEPARLSVGPKGCFMPLYEFRCADCRKKFSLHLTLTDFDRKRYRCPKCKGRKLEKLISRVSVVTSRKS